MKWGLRRALMSLALLFFSFAVVGCEPIEVPAWHFDFEPELVLPPIHLAVPESVAVNLEDRLVEEVLSKYEDEILDIVKTQGVDLDSVQALPGLIRLLMNLPDSYQGTIDQIDRTMMTYIKNEIYREVRESFPWDIAYWLAIDFELRAFLETAFEYVAENPDDLDVLVPEVLARTTATFRIALWVSDPLELFGFKKANGEKKFDEDEIDMLRRVSLVKLGARNLRASDEFDEKGRALFDFGAEDPVETHCEEGQLDLNWLSSYRVWVVKGRDDFNYGDRYRLHSVDVTAIPESKITLFEDDVMKSGANICGFHSDSSADMNVNLLDYVLHEEGFTIVIDLNGLGVATEFDLLARLRFLVETQLSAADLK